MVHFSLIKMVGNGNYAINTITYNQILFFYQLNVNKAHPDVLSVNSETGTDFYHRNNIFN